jgi:small ligand-binding sensory domain FIST
MADRADLCKSLPPRPLGSTLPEVPERRAPTALSALSERPDTRDAAREVATALRGGMIVRPDLLVVFGSFHHRALFSDALDILRAELHPAHLLASTARAVIGAAVHDGRASPAVGVEGRAALGALALSLPGVVAKPFLFDIVDGPPAVWSPEFVRSRVALPPEVSDAFGPLSHAGTLLVADPFSIHAGLAAASIDEAAGAGGARIVGALASGASHAGLNVLAADRRVAHMGLVGLSLFGDLSLDIVHAQGTRAVGRPLVVTRAKGSEIGELGGRPALEVTQEVFLSLNDHDRALFSRGVLVGVALDASRPRLGRGDFLVRPLRAVDEARRSLLLGDAIQTGATVQFHLDDPDAAADDLAMLLDAEALREPPVAALVFHGNRVAPAAGDGSEARDAADGRAPVVPVLATLSRRLGAIPLVGLESAGELAPLRGKTPLAGRTIAIALFRAGRAPRARAAPHASA